MKAKAKNFTTFEQWHYLDVRKKLGVNEGNATATFREWINDQHQIPERMKPLVAFYHQQLKTQHGFWNETELMMGFIGPFLMTIEWFTDDYNLFNDRPLKAKVKGYTVSGVVDGMVAHGAYEPYEPYFFLHEYKKMRGTDADPLGQLLIAMVVARELNQDEMPVYGCYVIGRYWTFVVLEGDSYVQSQGYDASDENEIQIIWSILHQTKLYVEERVQASLMKEHQ